MFAETMTQYKAMCLKCEKAGVVALDTETTGLDYHKDTVVGGSVCLPGAKEGTFFMMPGPKDRVALSKVASSKGIVKVFHNAKFDMHMLRHAGIATLLPIEDTYVLMRLLDENRNAYGVGKNYKLKELAKEYVSKDAGETQDKLKAWLEKEGKTMAALSSAPKALLAAYGANDALITLQLRDIIKAKLKEEGIPDSLIQREMEILYIAYLMEEEGAHVDTKFLDKYAADLEKDQKKLYKKMEEAFAKKELAEGFNPESDDMVAKVLICLGIELKEKTETGKFKVDKNVLEKIDHPFAKALIEHRRLGTIRQTFVEGIRNRAIKDKIHAEFDTAGTTTGRFSCRNPNLQNLDGRSLARQAFVPKKGYEFWSFDLKQIEPCILAHFVKSPPMTKAFREGWDFHTFNASVAFKVPYETLVADLKRPEGSEWRTAAELKRKKAKTLGLAMMYQAGGAKVAQGMGVPEAEGRRILADFYKAMPEVKKFQRDTTDAVIKRALDIAKTLGKAQVSPQGLIYAGKPLPKKQVPKPGLPGEFWEFPDYDSVSEMGWIVNPFGRKRRLRCADAYKAGNALIQGTAADFFKECTVQIWKQLDIIPVFSIHDELIFEFKKGLEHTQERIITIIKECGVKWFPEIPIRVDVAKSAKSLYHLEEVI